MYLPLIISSLQRISALISRKDQTLSDYMGVDTARQTAASSLKKANASIYMVSNTFAVVIIGATPCLPIHERQEYFAITDDI